MKVLLGVLFGVTLGLAMAPRLSQASQPEKGPAGGKGLEGTWQGTLNVKVKFRLVVRFAKKGGKLTGSLDSPDQKVEGLELDEATFKDGMLRFEIEKSNATFAGKLAKDGAKLAGRWMQGDLDLPLTFERQAGGKKAGKGLEGVWQGTLLIKKKLRLVIHLAKKKGKLTGSLDSPDQKAEGLEMDEATFKDGTLRFEIEQIGGVFEGKVQKQGGALEGHWKQSGLELPLTFTRQPAPKGANEAPGKGKGKVSGKGPEGYWLGPLEVGGKSLRMAARITRKKDGSLAGTFDSLDQGAKGLRLDGLTFKDGRLRFEIKQGGVVFEGKLARDGSAFVGEWRQGGKGLPLTLNRQAKEPVAAVRPQDPKKPYPYLEEEVTYENPKAKVKFEGTLTLPRGKGPFPAVLLITGSGPQNRDEELAGHRPFLVLSDYLTRRGLAVLRVDDRGVGGSTGDTMKSTTADFAGDALAGVEFLKGRKEIDPRRIGLAGHSEGGIVGPLAASQSRDVAFVVMLAGTGLSGEEIILLQTQLINKAAGVGAKELARIRREQELVFKAVKGAKDLAAAEKRFQELWDEKMAKLPEEKRKEAAKGEKALRLRLRPMMQPWMHYFLTHDPRPALRKVSCPVLALFGEKDLQVPPSANVPAIAKALAEGVCKDYAISTLPGLNHLLQTCKTGAPSEYSAIEETMAPLVLQTVADWIVRHTQARAK